MYFVKYGESYLHDPRTDDCILLDLSFDSSENSCGYCDFKIYPNHPMYKKLRERDVDNPVEVYDGDILLFSGFIYDLGTNFYLDGEVKCKGELDYLNDSIVRPYSTIKRGFGQTAPSTQNEYFVWLIEQHNAQVSPNKRFKIGLNQASNLYSSVYIFRENDRYPTTMEEIKEKLIDNANGGGYLRIRHEDGVRYIDYISEWTQTNTQMLEFGVNLTNYMQTDDSSEIYTYVIPLGARMSETDYDYDDGYFRTSDIIVNKNKTYYTLSENGYYSECNDLTAFEAGVTYYEYDYENDESNQLLTISALPDGTYSEPGYKKSGDMIYCEESTNRYGLIGMKYENSEITTREQLIEKGTIVLKEKVSPKRTIEIKAVDMHLINPNIKPIRIGEYVRICSYPHNLDDYFLCRNIDLDLNNPENSTYVLGTTYDTLTGQQNKRINALNASINSVYESAETANHEVVKVVKSVSSTYEEAKKAMEESLAAKDAANQATAKTELIESQVTEVVQNVNNVNTKAQEAIEKATASEAASGQASAIAEQIQNEINDVKGDADSLRDAIDSQIETKVTTMTVDYVSTTELTETKTELETSISQSATTIKTEADQTYAKKTELTEVQELLNTNINQNAESIAATAQEVTAIKADTTKAQEIANTATNLANEAQTGVMEAKDAAQAAQEIADQVQNNLNSFQTTVTNKFAEIELNADGLQTTVSKTQACIDDLAYNSRNLYLGTRNFDGNKWRNLDKWETWDPGDFGYIEYGRYGAWEGIYQEVDVKAGETYTFSFWAFGNAEVVMHVYTTLSDEEDITDVTDIELGNPTEEYVRYKATFNVIADGVLKVRVENSHDESWLQVYGLKLEHGDFSGEWTPAIEDPDYAFQSANERITTLEQTAEGFTAKIENSAKTATDYLNFSELGLIIGNMIAEELKKNVLIADDSVNIRDGETVLAKFAGDAIEFAKQVIFKADGIFLDNGDAFAHLGRNNVLWSGAYYMHGTQSITLSTNITRQLHGAVFVWSYYDGTSALDRDFTYFFVPKNHIEKNPGDGVRMSDPYIGMTKYLYVSNGTVSGHANNASSGTMNGIAWNNKNFVLRYVIGV